MQTSWNNNYYMWYIWHSWFIFRRARDLLGKVCVFTDGALTVLGCWSGFQLLVLNESPKIIRTLCMIHRQILVMKTTPQELHVVMESMNSVSFVKAITLNSDNFLCCATSWIQEQSSAVSHWREMTVKRKSFKTCFWVSWWTQKIFKWESKTAIGSTFQWWRRVADQIPWLDLCHLGWVTFITERTKCNRPRFLWKI